jgi:uncharacterized protein YycO
MRPLFRQTRPSVIPLAPHVRAEAGLEAPAAAYQAGDFVLVKTKSFNAKLIRFGQWVRFRGDDRRYIGWTHAALIVNDDGALVEAVGHGVRRSNLSAYQAADYAIVNTAAIVGPADRAEAVAFAEWCVGEQYGYLTILSVSIAMLTGSKLIFGVDGQNICSGLVARALERTRAIFQRSSSHISPADLAKMFDVPS